MTTQALGVNVGRNVSKVAAISKNQMRKWQLQAVQAPNTTDGAEALRGCVLCGLGTAQTTTPMCVSVLPLRVTGQC